MNMYMNMYIYEYVYKWVYVYHDKLLMNTIPSLSTLAASV